MRCSASVLIRIVLGLSCVLITWKVVSPNMRHKFVSVEGNTHWRPFRRDFARDPDVRRHYKEARICTQKERFQHLKKQCRKLYPNMAKEDLSFPPNHTLIDLKYKLAVCWMSKAGNTAIKALLVQSRGVNITRTFSNSHSLEVLHWNENISPYQLLFASYLNDTLRKRLPTDFYKLIQIRHPFSRIYSYYLDKLVDTSDVLSIHPWIVQEVLAFTRNSTGYSMDPPRFDELLTWIAKTKKSDEHWTLITDKCHPCSYDYDALLRVETIQKDGDILLNKIHNSVEGFPIRHSHQMFQPLQTYTHIPDFNVSGDILSYLLRYFRKDMTLFGYGWDEEERTAYCAIKTDTGDLCC